MREYDLIANKLIEMGSEVFNDNPVLRLSSFPLKEELNKGNLNEIKIRDNQLWINCECYNYDINIESKFDLIFRHSDISDYKEIKAILKYITFNVNGAPSLTLPKGYFALCLIEFDAIPSMLSHLRYSGEIIKKEEHDILFLTEKNVLNEMMECAKLPI